MVVLSADSVAYSPKHQIIPKQKEGRPRHIVGSVFKGRKTRINVRFSLTDRSTHPRYNIAVRRFTPETTRKAKKPGNKNKACQYREERPGRRRQLTLGHEGSAQLALRRTYSKTMLNEK